MTSTRPYLLRAMYDWMLDNGLTPQLVVNADENDVHVPRQFVSDGRIVLNISPTAVRNLDLGMQHVRFEARFSGAAFSVSVPVRCVAAIFCRENGAGMTFPDEEPEPQPPGVTDGADSGDAAPKGAASGQARAARRRSRLKVVK